MYDYLIFDAVNFGYKCHENYSDKDLKLSCPVKIGNRTVYKTLMAKMITTLDFLEKKFLNPDGKVIFLFDNYTSREELKASLIPADTHSQRKKLNPFYKANRKVARTEFYATLDLLNYYLKVSSSKYMVARIPHLEADDLLPTCVSYIGWDKKTLLVSEDSDWCKAMTSNIDTLPHLYGEPFTIDSFFEKHGYHPSEEHIKLEKMLYGDKSDNVACVFPEMNPQEKKYAVRTWTSVLDFLYESQQDPMLSKYALLFKDKERDIRLAYKMLSTIPVGMAHFKSVLVTGRDAKRLVESINSVIFPTGNGGIAPAFEFGNILVPRKAPEDCEYFTEYMNGWTSTKDKEGLL